MKKVRPALRRSASGISTTGDQSPRRPVPSPTRPAPGHRRASLESLVRNLAAWCIGCVPTLLAIRGEGTMVVSPSVQLVGQWWVAGPTAAWLALLAMVGGRRSTVAWSGVALLVVCAAGTASNVGRAVALVAVASVFVARAAIVDWPFPRSSLRRPRLVLPAVLLLAGAQCVWLRAFAPAPSLGLLGLAIVAVDLHHRGILPSVSGDQVAQRLAPAAQWCASSLDAVVLHISPLGRAIGRFGARSGWWSWTTGGAVVASMVLMAPVFHRYASGSVAELGSSDYATHLAYAMTTRAWPPHLSTPEPLFHYAVAAIRGPLGLALATTVVMSMIAGLTALVLVTLCRRPFAGRSGLGPVPAAAFAVGYLFVEGPGVIASALHVGNSFDWAPTNHMLLNPTDVTIVPFALALLWCVAGAVGRPSPSRGFGVALFSISALTTLAKPSFTLALLVASPIYLACSRRLGWPLARLLAVCFALPSALVLGWQTWFLQTGANQLPSAGIAIRPLETLRSVDLDRIGWLTLAPLLVVALCLWAGHRRFLGEPAVGLALWSLAVSVVVLLVFEESGLRRGDGTFAKPAFICWAVLNVVCWRFLVGEVATELATTAEQGGQPSFRRRSRPKWLAFAALFALVSLVAGAIAFTEAAGLMELPMRGSGR